MVAGVYAGAVGLGWRYPVKLTAGLLMGVGLMWWQDRRKDDLKWILVAGGLGMAVEIAAGVGGAWSYSAPYLLGIPLWLPVGYALGGLLLRRLIEK